MASINIPVILAFLLGITVHELAHAWTAVKLGDPTPRLEGRLTLNVLAHISLPGLLMLLIAGIGWAKPVRINTFNLRRPGTDMIWISLAGPAANIGLAVLGALLFRFGGGALPGVYGILLDLMLINLLLAFFNLLPVPPLDGAKLVLPFLPAHWAYQLQRAEAWGFLILLVLLRYLGLGQLLSRLSWEVTRFLLT